MFATEYLQTAFFVLVAMCVLALIFLAILGAVIFRIGLWIWDKHWELRGGRKAITIEDGVRSPRDRSSEQIPSDPPSLWARHL